MRHFTFLYWWVVVSFSWAIGNDQVFRLSSSNIDGDIYRVRDLYDHEEAANMLAKTRKTINLLISKLQQSYPSDKRVVKVSERYTGYFQEAETNQGKTSFTVNKGQQIHMCLRSPHTNKFEAENTIRYIAIHELAHVMSDSSDHTPEFWDNFRFLLSHAVKWKLYTSVDYRRHPTTYCGTRLTDAPLRLNRDRRTKSYL